MEKMKAGNWQRSGERDGDNSDRDVSVLALSDI